MFISMHVLITSIILSLASTFAIAADPEAEQDPSPITAAPPTVGIFSDLEQLTDKVKKGCPLIWENVNTEIDQAGIANDGSAEIWGSLEDKSEFEELLALAAENGQTSSVTGPGVEDISFVANYCARQRINLVTAMMASIPVDALVGMSSLTGKVQSIDGFLIGDIRTTGRATSAPGWVFLKGQTIGNVGSGATYTGSDLKEAFDLVKTWAPNGAAVTWAMTSTGAAEESMPQPRYIWASWESGVPVSLPDMRGRVIAGIDNKEEPLLAKDGADAYRVGGAFGARDHTLTINEMPRHNHTMNTTGNHRHNFTYEKSSQSSYNGSNATLRIPSHHVTTRNSTNTTAVQPAGNHRHTIYNKGASAAHNNVQPTMVFNMEMKITNKPTDFN